MYLSFTEFQQTIYWTNAFVHSLVSEHFCCSAKHDVMFIWINAGKNKYRQLPAILLINFKKILLRGFVL